MILLFFQKIIEFAQFSFSTFAQKGSILAIDMKNWKSLIKRLFVMSTVWANQNQSFFFTDPFGILVSIAYYNFTLVFYFYFFSEICDVDSICKNLVESLTFINDMSLENHPKFKTLTKCRPPKTKKAVFKVSKF